MKPRYKYNISIKVREDTERCDKIDRVLAFYGLSQTDTTALIDNLLHAWSSLQEFYVILDGQIAEKEKEISDLRRKRFAK